MFQIGGRKRLRKRGYAVDARPYRHHIAVRMTYYEAEIFSLIMCLTDSKMLGTDAEARRAFGRLCRKAQACDAAQKQRPRPRWEIEYEEAMNAFLATNPDKNESDFYNDTGFQLT